MTEVTHQTAIILLADIQDFTRLARQDPDAAVMISNRFRKVFANRIKEFDGTLIHHREDKSLAYFESSVRAAKCAMTIIHDLHQDEPEVPTSIALHMGELVFQKDDVFGSSISVVSHIESLGCDRSILMSTEVYEQLKENSSFEIQSMGYYLFKDITRPMEVYAVTNEGLVVPEKLVGPRATGKPMSAKELDKFNLEREGKQTLVVRLWKRGVPQLVAGYFVGATTILQFVDWFCKKIEISDQWTTLLLILFLSIIPSFIIYTYHREKIHMGKLSLFQKFFFPGNFLFTLMLILLVVGGKDLGAKNLVTSITNEYGESEEISYYKEEFSTPLLLFEFENESVDSSYAWMNGCVRECIFWKLSHKTYVTAKWGYQNNIVNRVQEAKDKNQQYFVTGSFYCEDGVFTMSPTVWQTKGSKKVSRSYYGKDFFSLIDSISLFILNEIDISKSTLQRYPDIPTSEIITNDLEAYRLNALAEKAVSDSVSIVYAREALEFDPEFSWPIRLLSFYYSSRHRDFEQAYQLNQLALQKSEGWGPALKLCGIARSFFLLGDIGQSIRILETPLNHNQYDYVRVFNLAMYQILAGRHGDALESLKTVYALSPNKIPAVFNHADLLLQTGQFKVGISFIEDHLKQYENPLLSPTLVDLNIMLAELLIHDRDYSRARQILTAQTLSHAKKDIIQLFLSHIDYLESNPGYEARLTEKTGKYRLEDWDYVADIALRNDRLMLLTYQTQSNYLYAISDSTYFHQYHRNAQYLGSRLIYHFRNQDVLTIELFKNQHNGHLVQNYWRQDDMILQAEEAFKKDQYLVAEQLFTESKVENPAHYYIDYYLRNLEYLSNPTIDSSALLNVDLVGRYGNHGFAMIDNTLVYLAPDYSRYKLVLLDPNTYWSPRRYKDVFEFSTDEYGSVMLRLYERDELKESQLKEQDSTN